jgi:phospholipid/cholesterol/gamma-HCH transport system substrate-binding protein
VRRLLAISVALAAAAGLVALVVGSSAQGSSSTRFDVIFDDARGMVGGQLVKIAGARAGTIDNIVVTPGFKARIEASVDSRFMPFHQDARCTIRPEGLIAENYIDCDPGSPNRPPLKASGGHPPTVPVQNTNEPVSLLDLFNMFNLPTRQRFTVLINELGIGTSGRGQDFNEVLRRANPSLALARQAITILARQRAQLQTILDATDTIAAEAARHPTNLQNFLDRTAALATQTASHRGNLALAINRLPGLLAATQPALQQLDTVAVQGTPLVQQLGAAVPALNHVQADLGPFVAKAKPGLAKLRSALKKAIPAIRRTTPVLTALRTYTHRSLPSTLLTSRLFKNLQQHGFTENFLSVVYYVGAALARFDSTSHMLPLLLVGADNGLCGNYATKPLPVCSAHFGAQPAYTPSAASSRHAAPGAARASAPAAPTQVQAGGTQTAQGQTPPAAAQAPSRKPGALQQVTSAALGTLQSILQPPPQSQNPRTLQGLLNYLLK